MKRSTMQHYLRPEQFKNFSRILDPDTVREAEQQYPTDKRVRKIPFVVHFYLLLTGIVTKAATLKNVILHFRLRNRWGAFSLPRFSKSALSRKNSNRPLTPLFHVFQRLVEYAKIEVVHPLRSLFEDVQIFDGTFFALIESLYSLFGGSRNRYQQNPRASIVACFSAVAQIPCDFVFGKSNVHEPRAAKKMIRQRKPGQKPILYIFDLLYPSYDFLMTVINRGHCFICKLKADLDPKQRKLSNCSRRHYDWLIQPFKSADKQFPQPLRAVRVKWADGNYYWYLTNLTDPQVFPKEIIASIYRWRWAIEIFFFDLKYIIKLQRFMSRSPNGIHMQIIMAMIVYVIIRLLINRAAQSYEIPLERFCFRDCATVFFAEASCFVHSTGTTTDPPDDDLSVVLLQFGIYSTDYESLYSRSINLCP